MREMFSLIDARYLKSSTLYALSLYLSRFPLNSTFNLGWLERNQDSLFNQCVMQATVYFTLHAVSHTLWNLCLENNCTIFMFLVCVHLWS